MGYARGCGSVGNRRGSALELVRGVDGVTDRKASLRVTGAAYDTGKDGPGIEGAR